MQSFRRKLLIAMMVVISAVTIIGLYAAQRRALQDAERDLQNDFQQQLKLLDRAGEMRHAELAERCRTLMAKPRLHAALEDNALDLLYPTAKDELRDLLQNAAGKADGLQAKFYRFLDAKGAVIPPPATAEAGVLSADEESRLQLRGLPETEEIGYVARSDGSVDEVFVEPIRSSENGELISALVAGFQPVVLQTGSAGMRAGIWLGAQLHLPGVSQEARSQLAAEISAGRQQGSFRAPAAGAPGLVFYKQLNPRSMFAPAYEICLYPLTDFVARQRRLRWEIGGAGALLLLVGLLASQLASARLSKPVEALAVQSAVHRAEREQAEAALATTHVELQRSARFSADASHQLKSPVTVLRAGLESLLARRDLAPEVYHELSSLLHQTYRLTGVINDLLLLSRMDAGRVQLDFATVDLTQLIAEWLDDLSALPDAVDVTISTELPPGLLITGERRYTSLIVQNLLENARKYNRPGGRMRVAAREEGEDVIVTVCNTGRAIPESAHGHIFERFHRGAMGEDVPGHGLGLNLARELARLHGGDLWLVESNGDWTEFAVRFRSARTLAAVAG